MGQVSQSQMLQTQISQTPEMQGSEPSQSIDVLVSLTSVALKDVSTLILDRVGSHVDLIPEISKHLISSGGKRLRPMLTLASAQLCGYEGKGHHKLAASVEFMHTATLLHDDVVDESDLRRGKPTAHRVWGNQASVLVGDFLLGQAFKMMVEVGSLEALSVLSNAAAVIAEGEVLQLNALRESQINIETYMQVIEAKTATLFAAACEVGAIIANRTDKESKALSDFGLHLGITFQLIDDALDYMGSAQTLGKNIGDDFREGKVTLPLLLAYENGSERDRTFWRQCLDADEVSDHDLQKAILLIQQSGALEETIEKAKQFGDQAIRDLDVFPGSEMKSALIDVIGFCVNRAH